MNFLSINVQGFGKLPKHKWVRDLCLKNCINFLSLKETKITLLDLSLIRSVWGNSYFDFASSSATGMSGGILCVWECGIKRVLLKKRTFSMDSFVVIKGLWVPLNINLMVIFVYAPQDPTAWRELWSRFVEFVAN